MSKSTSFPTPTLTPKISPINVGQNNNGGSSVFVPIATPQTDSSSATTSIQPNEEQECPSNDGLYWLEYYNGYSVEGVSFKATIKLEQPAGSQSTSITLPFDLLQPSDVLQIIQCNNIYRLIICQPNGTPVQSHDRGARVASFSRLFHSFNSLRSLVLPADFRSNPLMLEALKHHRNLVQLEIAMPTTFSVDEKARDRITFALVLGLQELQQLQVVIIPQILATFQVVVVLSKMDKLNYLKIKNTGKTSDGGDRFVDMLSEYDISSAHSFYALRWLDIDFMRTDPIKQAVLTKRFPCIAYL